MSIDPDGAETRHASQPSPSTSQGRVRRMSSDAAAAPSTTTTCMTTSQIGSPYWRAVMIALTIDGTP